MRKLKCGMLLFGLLTTCPIAANASYLLRLYNVDDVLSAYITNGTYSNQLLLQTSFLQDSGLVDISAFVTPGENDISLQLFNGPSGWTYGYEFLIDGDIYASGICGTVNSYGCNNNDYTSGDVWSDSIAFNVPLSDQSDVPEPSTIALLLGAAGGLLLLRKKRNARSSDIAPVAI